MSQACYLSLVLVIATSLGCASMCDSSMDCQYNAYGGVRDRVDRVNGRVASRFDPATSLEPVLVTEEPLPLAPDISDTGDGKPSEDEGKSNLTDELIRKLDQLESLPKIP